jgi:hypothetical protein
MPKSPGNAERLKVLEKPGMGYTPVIPAGGRLRQDDSKFIKRLSPKTNQKCLRHFKISNKNH